ncbi:MAG: hypothetical protein J7577_00770 [Sphingobacteriaceae bacterium]|nr:hypothetical protein [Sphingobacteriaceae bacterium]
MKYWTTQIKAINPNTNQLVEWMGPYIQADSLEAAESYCKENGLGYCKVIGEFDSEVPYDVLDGLKNFAEKIKHK